MGGWAKMRRNNRSQGVEGANATVFNRAKLEKHFGGVSDGHTRGKAKKAQTESDCTVTGYTSLDPRHPPDSMLGSDKQVFWTSTGMFPQQFVVKLPDTYSVKGVLLTCLNVKGIKIE